MRLFLSLCGKVTSLFVTSSLLHSFLGSPPLPKNKTRRKREAPLVDSTLLRFLSTQKQTQPSDTTLIPDTLLPKEDRIQPPSSLVSWLGQYNRNRVAQTLLRMENAGSISQETALHAGEAVQQHVLARTARQRLRLFLRKRDQLWVNAEENDVDDDDEVTRLLTEKKEETTTIDSTRFQHDRFTHVVELLVEQGLTANDICSILTHTPSVALMRPRNGENTLESTCHRVLHHVLSDSLQLRRYDARKVRVHHTQTHTHTIHFVFFIVVVVLT